MHKRRSLQLFCGICVLLFLGLMYGWSIFVAPLEATFGWNRAQTSLAFTFSLSFFCIGGLASGLLLRRHRARSVLRLSALCELLGFFLASRVHSLWGLYLSYGLLGGLGVGLGYNAVLSTVCQWFPEKPGFCSGLMLLFFGMGGLLLGSGASALIGLFGWRTTFLVLSLLFASVLLLCAQAVRVPSEEETAQLPAPLPAREEERREDVEPRQMFAKTSFYLFLLWCTFNSMIGLSMVGQAAPLTAEAHTALLPALGAGLVSCCNGLGRLLAGSSYDRFGRLKTMLGSFTALTLAILSLWGALAARSLALLLTGFIFLGLGYGAMPAISAAGARALYGRRYYPLNYGLINLHAAPGSLLSSLIAGNIQAHYGTYLPMFPVLLALLLPYLALTLLLRKA